MKKFHYSEWDGTQAETNFNEDALFNEFAEFLLKEGDINAALQWMIIQYLNEHPDINLMSMDEYTEYLSSLEEEYFKQFNMDYALDDIEKEISNILTEEIKELEKTHKGSQRELAEQKFWIENLPKPLSKAIGSLKSHEFKSAKAKASFEKLLRKHEDLRQLEDFLDQHKDDFYGENPVNFDEAVEIMKEFKRLEKLQADMKKGDFLQINIEDMKFFLDPSLAEIFEYLQSTVNKLEKAGYLSTEGGISLTPKGIRKIGQTALESIYSNLKKDQFGIHETTISGVGTIKPDSIKKYEFGDPFNIHIGATLMNSIKREGSGKSLRISDRDFEVYDVDYTTHSTTVLLIDMSFSMAWSGRFTGAKRVAIALDHLISTKFPKDNFYIVGFSSRARLITKKELPHLMLVDGSRDMGNAFTNLQDGLKLGSELIARHRSINKQIILITDGQPTAYYHNSQLHFEWPMGFGGVSPRACRETLKEVNRCTKSDIVINTFMLDSTPSLQAFIQEMTRINKGRAFYTSPSDLGKFILVDYVEKKRKKVS